MIPDLIVCWPVSCDYPLWRKWLAANRLRFAEVFVVFTDHSGEDISEWVRDHLPARVSTLHSHAESGRDWRDAAVNMALDHSKAEWVWFTEQDFFITDPEFWDSIAREATGVKVIGWRDSTGRLHPSCLFVKRSVIDKTTRYFGTPPIDHFWTFTHELMDAEDHSEFVEGFEHLQGLTQNHSLIDRGESDGIFERDRFRQYLRDCLASGVALEPGWEARARREVA